VTRCCCSFLKFIPVFTDQERAQAVTLEDIAIWLANILPGVSAFVAIIICWIFLTEGPNRQGYEGVKRRLDRLRDWKDECPDEGDSWVKAMRWFFPVASTRAALGSESRWVQRERWRDPKRLALAAAFVISCFFLGGVALWLYIAWLASEAIGVGLLALSAVLRLAKSPFFETEREMVELERELQGEEHRMAMMKRYATQLVGKDLLDGLDDDDAARKGQIVDPEKKKAKEIDLKLFEGLRAKTIGGVALAKSAGMSLVFGVVYFVKFWFDTMLLRLTLVSLNTPGIDNITTETYDDSTPNVGGLKAIQTAIVASLREVQKTVGDSVGGSIGIPKCEGPTVLFGVMVLTIVAVLLIRTVNMDLMGLFFASMKVVRANRPRFQGMLMLVTLGIAGAVVFSVAQALVLMFMRSLLLANPFSQDKWMCEQDDSMAVVTGKGMILLVAVVGLVAFFLSINGRFYGSPLFIDKLRKWAELDLRHVRERRELGGGMTTTSRTARESGHSLTDEEEQEDEEEENKRKRRKYWSDLRMRLIVWFGAAFPTSFGLWFDRYNIRAYLLKERSMSYSEDFNDTATCPDCHEFHADYDGMMKQSSRAVSLVWQLFPYGVFLGKLAEYANDPPLYYRGDICACGNLRKVPRSHAVLDVNGSSVVEELKTGGKGWKGGFVLNLGVFVADYLSYYGARLLSLGVYVLAVVAAVTVTARNVRRTVPVFVFVGFALAFARAFFMHMLPVLGLYLVELGSPGRVAKKKKAIEMVAILKRRDRERQAEALAQFRASSSSTAGAGPEPWEMLAGRRSYLDENRRPYWTFAVVSTKTALVLTVTILATKGLSYGVTVFLGVLMTPLLGWLIMYISKAAMRPVLYPVPNEARAAAATGGVWSFRPALYESIYVAIELIAVIPAVSLTYSFTTGFVTGLAIIILTYFPIQLLLSKRIEEMELNYDTIDWIALDNAWSGNRYTRLACAIIGSITGFLSGIFLARDLLTSEAFVSIVVPSISVGITVSVAVTVLLTTLIDDPKVVLFGASSAVIVFAIIGPLVHFAIGVPLALLVFLIFGARRESVQVHKKLQTLIANKAAKLAKLQKLKDQKLKVSNAIALVQANNSSSVSPSVSPPLSPVSPVADAPESSTALVPMATAKPRAAGDHPAFQKLAALRKLREKKKQAESTALMDGEEEENVLTMKISLRPRNGAASPAAAVALPNAVASREPSPERKLEDGAAVAEQQEEEEPKLEMLGSPKAASPVSAARVVETMLSPPPRVKYSLGSLAKKNVKPTKDNNTN
jgi:hypothetical protein